MIFFILFKSIKLQSSLLIPIIDIMSGRIVSAISTFLRLTFNISQNLEVWFQGSFALVEVGRYEYLWLTLISTTLIYLFANQLTLVALGKSIATNLGLNYNRYLIIATTLVSLTVGVVSAVIGYLPFIGLIVPNIISMQKGDHAKQNLPSVALLGMIVILACDIIAHWIIMPFEVPVSLVLGSLGSMFFLFLLFSQSKKQL